MAPSLAIITGVALLMFLVASQLDTRAMARARISRRRRRLAAPLNWFVRTTSTPREAAEDEADLSDPRGRR